MNRLIPTAVVDKNGKRTTVHKKADDRSIASSALGSIAPRVTPAASNAKVHKVAANVPKKSSFVRTVVGQLISEAAMYQLDWITPEKVSISDDDAYAFLRYGLTLQEAAVAVQQGLTVDDMDAFDYGRSRGNAIWNMERTGTRSRSSCHMAKSMDRLQEAGVPANVASKVLSNGLQDEFFDRSLSDEQLVGMFSKWKYRKAATDPYGTVTQDLILEGFIYGDLPFELSKHSLADLEDLSSEVRHLRDSSDTELVEAIKDRDYFIRLADVAVTKIKGYKGLESAHSLVQRFGEEVLELDSPVRASAYVNFASEVVEKSTFAGVEGARYIEKVIKLTKEAYPDDFYRTQAKDNESWGGIYRPSTSTYLRNWELLHLMGEGITEEQAFENIVERGVAPELVPTVVRDGIATSLVDGAL